MRPPKRIAVDFDDTIAESLGFPIIGAPKPGAAQALSTLRRMGYKIIIWSCRTCHYDYDIYGGDPNQYPLERPAVQDMMRWLAEHQIEYDEIDDGSMGKPSADYYIDDKAVHFDANWVDIAAHIVRADMNADVRESAKAKDAEATENTRTCRILPFVRSKPSPPISDGPQRA